MNYDFMNGQKKGRRYKKRSEDPAVINNHGPSIFNFNSMNTDDETFSLEGFDDASDGKTEKDKKKDVPPPIFKFDSIDTDDKTFSFKAFNDALEKDGKTSFDFDDASEKDGKTSFDFGGSDSSFTFAGSPSDDDKETVRKKTRKKKVKKKTILSFLGGPDKEATASALETFSTPRFEVMLNAFMKFQICSLSREQYRHALNICVRKPQMRKCVLYNLLMDQVYESNLDYSWFPRSFLFLNVEDLAKCTKVSRSVYFLSLSTLGAQMFHSKRHRIVSDNLQKLPIKVQPSFVGWIRKCRGRFENVTKATRIKHAYLALNRAMVTRRFESIESFLRCSSSGMLGSLVGFTWRYVDSIKHSILHSNTKH